MKLNFYIATFGCKVNGYESQNIRESFLASGHTEVENAADADVCIVNSCTVTAQADAKCRHFISRVRRISPDCILVLCGCFAQAFPGKAEGLGCDIICGNRNKTKILTLVYDFINDRRRRIEIPKNAGLERMNNSQASGKTRAYLKIQDGCDLYCSYCIIPYARGKSCSKPLAEIKEETCRLVLSGHKEIILTGINLCRYGSDLGNGVRLIDAVEAADSAEGDFRIRLSSMEPELVSDEDIKRMKAIKRLCPQFHLSLQSGCDRTLKAMNRRYDTGEYSELCKKLRTAFPHCAITTDIMVGFPQETDEDFEKSLEFVKKTGFASAHIFPYSRRSGTAADRMDGHNDGRTKTRRAAEMTEVCRRSQLKYNESFVGKEVETLFERENSPDFHQGHSREYILVKVPRNGGGSLWRQFRRVKIIEAREDHCIGQIVGNGE